MFPIFKTGCSKFVMLIILIITLIRPPICSGIDFNIKSSTLKLTTWDREKIIFDHDFATTAKQIKQQLIYNRPQHEKYDMPLYADFHNNPTVTIGLHFRLIEIVDLDTESEEMKLTYTLQLFWYDQNLAWYKPKLSETPPSFLAEIIKNKVLNSPENIKSLEIKTRDLLVPMQDAILDLQKNPESRQLSETLDFLYTRYFTAATELRPDGFYNTFDNRMRKFNRTEKHEFRKLLAAQFITVPSSDIWTPNIIAYNANTGKHFPFMQEMEDQTDCTIYADGLVVWEPIISHTVSCDMTLSHFPFDIQMCNLDIGSWYHNAENVKIQLADTTDYLNRLVNASDNPLFQARHEFNIPLDKGFTEGPINAHSYQEADSDLNHGEWSFISAGIRVGKESFDHKSWVRFYIILKRQPINYLLNVGLTCLVLLFTAGLGFYIPADSDRLNLMFSILLTMAVYQMIIAEYIPKGTPNSPILAIFILVAIMITNVCALVCMALVRLHKLRISGNILMKETLWTITIYLMGFVGAGQKNIKYREAMIKLQHQIITPDDKYYEGKLRGLDSLRSLASKLKHSKKTGKSLKEIITGDRVIHKQKPQHEHSVYKEYLSYGKKSKHNRLLHRSLMSKIRCLILENLEPKHELNEEEILGLIEEIRGQQYDIFSIVLNRMFGVIYLITSAILLAAFFMVMLFIFLGIFTIVIFVKCSHRVNIFKNMNDITAAILTDTMRIRSNII